MTECFLFILSVEYDKLQEIPYELMKARAKVIGLFHKNHLNLNLNFDEQKKEVMFKCIWDAIETNKIHPTKNNEKLVRKTVHYIWDMTKEKIKFFKKNLKKVFESC